MIGVRYILGLVCLSSVAATAQVSLTSDPQALSISAGSVAAMSKSVVLHDITLNANVTYMAGSDQESGSAILQASGTTQSRVDLILSGGERIETRSTNSSAPVGAWSAAGTTRASALHNCWTDASWFYPALSSLASTSNPNYVFKFIGTETWNGLNAQHVRVFQSGPLPDTQRLSVMDFYLDPASLLPLGIAYLIHPDNNLGVDIPVQVLFANYGVLGGVLVPQRIQRVVNGVVTLDFTITTANVNTGISSSIFNLQ